MKTAVLMLLSAALAVVPTVGAAQSSATDKTERRTETAVGKTTSASKYGWITSKTKIALYANDRVSGNAINVDTENGAVTLRGKVASSDEKEGGRGTKPARMPSARAYAAA